MKLSFSLLHPMLILLMLSMTLRGGENRAADALQAEVTKLLDRMTLEEEVGQMTQVTLQVVSSKKGTITQKHQLDEDKLRDAIIDRHVGSILNVYDIALSVDEWQALITRIQNIATRETRLKVPVIYGIDAIHGANYTAEATLFPQSIAFAATRNPVLLKKASEITAYEVRASGIPWNFNPVLGVGRNPLWPRLWETFGEDPYLCSVLGRAYVKGMEGDDNNIGSPEKVAACMKHYIGYSFPLSGKDRTPAWIPERMLREYFLPPFRAAVEAGVHTVMLNSGEVNGIPVHSDSYLLTQVLRNELGFEGFAVSDWEDVKRIYTRDKVAESPKEAVRMAVMAGVDMSMVPYDYSFPDLLVELVRNGEVPMARIDEAVSRILRVKFELGLFDNPYPDAAMKARVGSEASTKVSLTAAREAMTLLKNDESFLPLRKDLKVMISGPAADRRSVLNGGWTYTWQGNEESFYPENKKTIVEAIAAKIGQDNVEFVRGATFTKLENVDEAVHAAKAADVAIVCIGEDTYTETVGNIHDLTLPSAQLELVSALQQSGTPVVLVLVQGRPRVITPVVADAQAILLAYLPGPEGGRAIADVLFGDFNPSGRLPYTYPRSPNDLVCYDHKPLETDDGNKLNPLWTFGHGLSYTNFEYSGLKLNKDTFKAGESIEVSVRVKNIGDRAGKEIVELYVTDLVASVSPSVRRLKGFFGVRLEPGKDEQVKFRLEHNDLAFVGRDNKPVVEPGDFLVSVGSLSTQFRIISDEQRR